MSDTPSHAHIKQEIDTTSCCSPAPSSGTFSNNTQHAFLYNNSPVTTVRNNECTHSSIVLTKYHALTNEKKCSISSLKTCTAN